MKAPVVRAARFCRPRPIRLRVVALLSVAICPVSPSRGDRPDPLVAAGEPAGLFARPLLELEDVPICSLTSDGTTLYFAKAKRSGVELWTISKDGGTASRVFAAASFQSAPVIAGDQAYFLDDGGALRRASVRGGPAVTLVDARRVARLIKAPVEHRPEPSPCSIPTAGPPRLPHTLVVDGDSLFWLDVHRGALFVAPRRGGAPAVLAKGMVLSGESPQLVQFDQSLYFVASDGAGTRIMKVPKGGAGKVTEVARLPQGSGRLLADSTRIIWATDEEVVGLSSDGKPPFRRPVPRQETAVPLSLSVCDLAIAGDEMVVSRCGDLGDGSVVGLPSSKGSARILAAERTFPVDLVVDRDAIYFVEMGKKAPPQSGADRTSCCAIWSTRR